LREFAKGNEAMSLETVLALICATLLLIYLVYALLRPEKF
jgi:K+-transporting ATPase KdpF subunit